MWAAGLGKGELSAANSGSPDVACLAVHPMPPVCTLFPPAGLLAAVNNAMAQALLPDALLNGSTLSSRRAPDPTAGAADEQLLPWEGVDVRHLQ